MNHELIDAVTSINGAQFASLVYTSKSDNSTSRYTINLGFNYNKLVEKSLTELEILRSEEASGYTPIQLQALNEVTSSLQQTQSSHLEGKSNPSYTKNNQYTDIGNGLKINEKDQSLQLFGLIHSKVVLQEGTPKKPVKSSPLTIAKNEIRSKLSISKFREFALDKECLSKAKINGDILVLD